MQERVLVKEPEREQALVLECPNRYSYQLPVLTPVLVLLEQRPNLYWKQFVRRPIDCLVCPRYLGLVDLLLLVPVLA